jgi:uncharacterized SAM-binding protein YcdF (DUF218 family)
MSDLFYWLSKLIWLFISPDSLLLIWFGIGILLLWLGRVIWAKRLLGALLFLLLLIGFFPVGSWLFYPLESRYSANPELQKVDGIVALSGALDPMKTQLWNQVVSNGAAERNFAFMHLAREFPEAKLIYTGGASSMVNQNHKAADVAKRLFNEQGLDLSRIIFERESRNTWENGLFTKQLVEPKVGERWVLITTAWHMPRSVGVFCKVGWDVIPYPVDFQTKPGHLFAVNWNFAGNLQDLVVAVKAWVGQIAYQLTGKSC